MKKCFTILGGILLGFLVLLCMDIMLDRAIQSAALDSDESSFARSEAADLCGQPQEPDRIPINNLNLPDEPPNDAPLIYRTLPNSSRQYPLVQTPWEPGWEVIPNRNQLPPHLQKLIRDAIAARQAEEAKCPR